MNENKELRRVLNKLQKLIEAQRKKCDERMEAGKDFHARSTWGACAVTCDVIESYVVNEIDFLDQREAKNVSECRAVLGTSSE